MSDQSVFLKQLEAVQQRLQRTLPEQLEQLASADQRLSDAMQHGLMNGGKRLRPFLLYTTAMTFGGSMEQADIPAAALEMVHSYSLVHDDLPAMDDDDLRRGQPTCHIQYDEATAILAGDALLTGAFQRLAQAPTLMPQQLIKLIQLLADASGAAGMVAGQSIDLAHVNQTMSQDQLQQMHRLKTGALIKAAVLMGATVAAPQLSAVIMHKLELYADCLGLAFQVQDDILDIEGDTQTLGKQQGADEALNKPTYPAILGLDAAKQLAADLVNQAQTALQEISDLGRQENEHYSTEGLAAVASYIIARRY